MAKMRTSVEIRNQVLELKKQGKGKKAIARTLKIARNTVKKILKVRNYKPCFSPTSPPGGSARRAF